MHQPGLQAHGNSLKSPGHFPKLKHRPSPPQVSRCGTACTPGSLRGQAQASPLPCQACLHKALSIGSGAGSHKPHPQQEMKPELWDAGSRVPGPTPGTAIPTHRPSAQGVRPPGEGVRAPQKDAVPGRCGVGTGQAQPAASPPCPALDASGPRTRDRPPPPTFPPQQPGAGGIA